MVVLAYSGIRVADNPPRRRQSLLVSSCEQEKLKLQKVYLFIQWKERDIQNIIEEKQNSFYHNDDTDERWALARVVFVKLLFFLYCILNVSL